jgi:hypothetical protein
VQNSTFLIVLLTVKQLNRTWDDVTFGSRNRARLGETLSKSDTKISIVSLFSEPVNRAAQRLEARY